MINININVNININIIISQFTVSLLSYNIKISVCENFLYFHFNSETVILIIKSLCCIFFFRDFTLYRFFLKIIILNSTLFLNSV